MASSKKVPGSESNGGFKTVTFGFDKNDVNMYIANLRRKMKTMEEEFQQKLSSALENPAASSDALNHEREVIRAETEKLWGEKLSERNQILKQQQDRINELEDELRMSKEKIASLRTQLSAATSENNSDGVIRARAAKAYMQFTRELRFISGSVEKTLQEMEQRWKGDFFESALNIATESDGQNFEEESALSEKNPAQRDISDGNIPFGEDFGGTDNTDFEEETKNEGKSLSKTVSKPIREPLPEKSKRDIGNYSERYADKKVFGSVPHEFVSEAPEKGAVQTAYEQTAEAAPKYSEPAPKQTGKEFEGFGELLADEGEPVYSPRISPSKREEKKAPDHRQYAAEFNMDDDLSSLLADEPDNGKISDDEFEKLLTPTTAENEFFITENERKAIKGDDLDALTLSDIVINPGEIKEDLGEMLKEREEEELDAFKEMFVTAADESERSDGLGISAENVEAGMELAGFPRKEKTDGGNGGKNEDLFDFSFLAAEADDEDDMSTDASFNGML